MTTNLRLIRRSCGGILRETFRTAYINRPFKPVILRRGFPAVNIERNLHLTAVRQTEDTTRENLDEEERILSSILSLSVDNVLTHGWSLTAVEEAVKSLGYPPVTAGLVESPHQIVLHHISSSNAALDAWMVKEVASLTAEGQRLPIGKFVRSCIIKRLSMNGALIRGGVWGEGVALVCQSDPGRAVQSWQEVCDDIWYRAGDTSLDINWYTKRISLAAVMAATDLFMLQDNSPDFQESWNFLDRRLQDLALMPTISKIPEDALAVADGLFQTLKILSGVRR